MTNKNKGFTLIELLIVIGIIAILATAIIIAVNPGQRIQEARDATYKAHQQALATAGYTYMFDESTTSLPADCTTVNSTCVDELGLGETPAHPGGVSYTMSVSGGRITVGSSGQTTTYPEKTF